MVIIRMRSSAMSVPINLSARGPIDKQQLNWMTLACDSKPIPACRFTLRTPPPGIKGHLTNPSASAVPVEAEYGALQFVPGTHHLGIQEHDNLATGSLPTTSFDPAEGTEVITLLMEPGDFVVFNNRVFHRSTVNHASSIRWSVDFRYSAAGTPMGELWHREMRFVVRSSREPNSVPGWDQVAELWQQSSQREEFP